MKINYRGNVSVITSSLQTALADIKKGKDPQAIPAERGEVSVQLINRSGEINNGSFRVSAPDNSDLLKGYRFFVKIHLDDPCRNLRDDLKSLQRRLRVAQADNALSEIELLQRQIASIEPQLTACEVTTQVTGIKFGFPVLIFRTMDIFRSAVNETTIRNLRIFFKILDQVDIGGFPTFWSNQELTTMVQNEASDANLEVVRVFTDRNKLRINFNYTKKIIIIDREISGSISLNVEPSDNHDFRKIISIEVSDFDLEGVDGEIAEHVWSSTIEGIIDSTISQVEAKINTMFASGLSGHFSEGRTVTLAAVAKKREGIHVSVAIGILLGMPSDPCQGIRDEILFLKNDLRAAILEGLENQVDFLKGKIAATERSLKNCRQLQKGDEPVPNLTFSPSSISFGAAPVGDIRTRTLTIESTTDADVSISFPGSNNGAFHWRGFDGTIAGNDNMVVVLEFIPGSKGSAQTSLRITSNATGSPHIITLTGRGVGGVPF